jgi:V/A-type H+-transporting ATPase subunit D
MAIMNVNPTRMELSKLKQQLSIATRGHKLLKDKQDELVRQFMLIIKRNRALRMEVETKLKKIFSHFGNAQLQMSHQGIMEALMVPANAAHIGVGSKTIMNIKVPTVDYKDQEKVDLTYGFAYTTSELDQAVLALSKLLPKLIELAQIEKSCDMLAFEIEKTRRRVNAIEYIMIPDMQETIRYITQKLEDAERSNIIRLMKSKEIILSKQNNS